MAGCCHQACLAKGQRSARWRCSSPTASAASRTARAFSIRVQLVRGEGRDVSAKYGRRGGGS